VGGLAENVNEEILQAAFLPFGNLKDINIPLDHATGKHRGADRQHQQQRDGWTVSCAMHVACFVVCLCKWT
jgi:peptidyl-prolyl isomerase E (cyclophilin E)